MMFYFIIFYTKIRYNANILFKTRIHRLDFIYGFGEWEEGYVSFIFHSFS